MSNKKWLRSHVERCLQDVWELCRVTADDDGDYPFRAGTAAGFVRIETYKPAMIRVWAVAARDVPRSAKLLAEINDVNVRSRSASVNWTDGLVIVEQAVHVSGVSRKTLRHALDAVGHVSSDVGPMIAAVFGGATPYPADELGITEEAS